jgi:hypothetical protein
MDNDKMKYEVKNICKEVIILLKPLFENKDLVLLYGAISNCLITLGKVLEIPHDKQKALFNNLLNDVNQHNEKNPNTDK